MRDKEEGKFPSFRGKGPKVNGYAHTSTSTKSPKAQRIARLKARSKAA